MKLRILSDLHLDHGQFYPTLPQLPADVTILAGDIWNGLNSVAWAESRYSGPVIYIPGNHEYYGESYVEHRAKMLAASTPQVTVGDNTTVVIGDTRFLCATLWPDFQLVGDQILSMLDAECRINDYRHIRYQAWGRRIKPWDQKDFHAESRQYLTFELEKPFSGKTVVVTHYAPSIRSVAQQYWEDKRHYYLNAYYASDMEGLMRKFNPTLWVHGHTHTSFDYVPLDTTTRVICNPRGYLPDWLNPDFNENLIVEI